MTCSEREAVVEELLCRSAFVHIFLSIFYKSTISESLMRGPEGMVWLV